ncbi:LytR C-terminal domain-containing protein [Arthrobacter sp. TMP15]|uniref:LytR C-terminal domain-containing protein n=1 Tax=Arthrobacter sp. TMP15 TaxID=3140789 RepID=UPI0031BA66BB
MSKYPRDEFDAVEESSARHGVHRASMDPQGRSLMPLMIFGVVALCIGLLAFIIMPKMLNTTNAPVVAKTTSAPAESAEAEATTEAPATSAVETPAPEPETTTEAAPDSVVDKSAPVAIFNATGTPGLAARYSGLVTADGWAVSQSANWAGQRQNTSVIFYNGIEQKANADELGAVLKITVLVDTAELGIPLAVVLGPGA